MKEVQLPCRDLRSHQKFHVSGYDTIDVRIVGSDVPRSGDGVQGDEHLDRDEAYSLDVVLHASGSENISELVN